MKKENYLVKYTELENKILKLQNTIDAIGFLSLANTLILLTWIGTKGF